jgi:hypothetical protein
MARGIRMESRHRLAPAFATRRATLLATHCGDATECFELWE